MSYNVYIYIWYCRNGDERLEVARRGDWMSEHECMRMRVLWELVFIYIFAVCAGAGAVTIQYTVDKYTWLSMLVVSCAGRNALTIIYVAILSLSLSISCSLVPFLSLLPSLSHTHTAQSYNWRFQCNNNNVYGPFCYSGGL